MDSLTPSQSMQLYGIDSKLQPSISSLLNSVHGRDNERATRMDRSFTVGLCRDLRNVHVFFEHGHHLTVKVNPRTKPGIFARSRSPPLEKRIAPISVSGLK